MPRALARLLALVSAAVLLVSALVAGTGAPVAAADPAFHQPPVGTCHALTYRQANEKASTPGSAVPCSQPHTARTVAVRQLRGEVDWSDYDRIYGAVAASCAAGLKRALGATPRSRALSAYAVYFFVPSPAERARGASWVRCDVALPSGGKLVRLPSGRARLLPAGALPDRLSRCLDRKFLVTACAGAHSYRAAGLVKLPFRRYPGPRAYQRLAERRCPGLVSTRVWRWTAPGKETFRSADRFMVCYDKTAR